MPLLDADAWIRRLATETSGRAAILAFYDHRVGAITRDPAHARVPVDDHLVHRGDGVFETLLFQDRGVIGLDAHLRRLKHSAEELSIALPCSWQALRDIILAVAAASGRDNGELRILVSRGPGGFGLDPAECSQAGLYIVAYEQAAPASPGLECGATACRSRIPVKPPILARIKTTNYLLNVLMVLEASQRGVDFSFSFDDSEFLAEAAIANVILVDQEGVLVLPEFRNALVGTTTLKVAEVAAAAMPVVWRPVPEQDLFAAREIMVLGTAHGCVSVVSYEDRAVNDGRPGPVAERLRSLLQTTLQQERVLF